MSLFSATKLSYFLTYHTAVVAVGCCSSANMDLENDNFIPFMVWKCVARVIYGCRMFYIIYKITNLSFQLSIKIAIGHNGT